jgi:SOS response regulatory protein OraA/RecX
LGPGNETVPGNEKGPESETAGPGYGFERGYRVALGLLRTKERFVGEVRLGLLNKGFEERDVESVLEVLVRKGLLSEARALEALLRSNAGVKRRSMEALARIAAERGASPESLAALTAEPEPSPIVLLQRYDPASKRDRLRAAALLARRGFEPDLISTTIAAYFEDATGAEDE